MIAVAFFAAMLGLAVGWFIGRRDGVADIDVELGALVERIKKSQPSCKSCGEAFTAVCIHAPCERAWRHPEAETEEVPR